MARRHYGKGMWDCSPTELSRLAAMCEDELTATVAAVDQGTMLVREVACGCPTTGTYLPDGRPDIRTGRVQHNCGGAA